MAVIQWAREQQRLIDLPEPIQQELAKNFRKWSSRWQKELASEELPPLIDEAVKAKLAKGIPENPEQQKAEQPHPVLGRDEEVLAQPQPLRSPHRNEQKQQRHGRKQQPDRETPAKQNDSRRNRGDRSENRSQQDTR